MQMSPFAWKKGAMFVWATVISNETEDATATTRKEMKHTPASNNCMLSPQKKMFN
jgi:hypothetical protein